MAPLQTGKQRASLISLNYYKEATPLDKWKAKLGWVALFATLAWVGVSLAMPAHFDCQASRGPVAAVHQIWDNQCNRCHESFAPVSSNSWYLPGVHDFSKNVGESNQKCQECHAGPDHFDKQPQDRTCAACHRDHGGRDASLISRADGDCVQCHKDLSKHPSPSKVAFQKSILSFAEGHPNFRSIKADPGKLKFNHQRHLAPGMRLEKDKETGGEIQTLAKIPEEFRQRYKDGQADKDDSAAVQLQCASCHQLDARDFSKDKKLPSSQLVSQRADGAYFAPISYENQCQACHPLTLERKVPDNAKAGYVAVPHRWQPKEIHDYLVDAYTAKFARGQAEFQGKKLARPLPGKVPEVLDTTVRDEIHMKVNFAEKDLFLSNRMCAECHYFEGKGGKSIPEAIKPGAFPDLHVAATSVPQVWFEYAKFNHAAHRAVDCMECHSAAKSSDKHTDILIPGKDNCQKCHTPTVVHRASGARSNCTECHQYHNGQHALQGVGGAARMPSKLTKIEGFLSGR